MPGVIDTHTFGNRGAGHFIVGQLDPNKSNEEGNIAVSQGDLKAGQPLGEVTASAGTFHPLDPGASDGTQNFAGILWADAPDNTAEQRVAYTARDAVVNGNSLQYANSLTQPQLDAMVAQAEALGIIIRF